MEYNNIYIGERYVPIFKGIWANNVAYEPLSIVQFGNNSYTSKRAVPIGIIPTNEDYWALTSNYNGHIAYLQSQIDALKPLAYSKKVRKTLFIGDSFFSGVDGITSNLPSVINTAIGASATYNKARGSTGFVRNEGGMNFANQLQAAIDDSNIPKNEITDIIIGGGVNDEFSTTESQYYEAITNIKNRCASFPNASVWVIPMMYGTPSLSFNDTEKIQKIVNALQRSGGVNILPGSWQVLHGLNSSLYMHDNIHPNSAGYHLLGCFIGNWINGTNYYQRFTGAQIIDEYNGVFDYCYTIINGICHLKGSLVLRGHVYTKNTTLFTIAGAANGSIEPFATVVTAGVPGSNHVYIDKNGNIKCDNDIGDIDLVFSGCYPLFPDYPIGN